ncbi:hypothetical protein JOD43_003828 [Pullulanibacillus pueri]|uniref:Uncharacterized protein n=1 Tax=Pullulanibacillus pueri TaxID=1437324 RepID=A0A8J2ZZW2_9BACL|nr:hypothetical protein [Pullulanibacillus pueri]MBM7683648.1 hypothetical protein [Pullulanibacillus pueri]GGH87227.1 hypothetical protein GCM10007096_36760 [Pullulanibacillus pueri]
MRHVWGWLVIASFGLALIGISHYGASKPPDIVVKSGNISLITKSGGYEWRDDHQALVADGTAPEQIAEKMKGDELKSKTPIILSFADDSHPQVKLYLWKNEKRERVKSVTSQAFTTPDEGGRYIYEATALWEKGKATYIFVVNVKE